MFAIIKYQVTPRDNLSIQLLFESPSKDIYLYSLGKQPLRYFYFLEDTFVESETLAAADERPVGVDVAVGFPREALEA